MTNSELQDPLEQRWIVLDHLLKYLVKKDYEIMREVVENLQQGRSLINFYIEDPTDPSRAAEVGKIDSLLTDTERRLMDVASAEGQDFIDDWNNKLLDASKGKEVFKVVKIQSKFIPGLPANFDFIRFNFQKPIPEERFIEICEYENVIIELDENDSSVFIFGEKPNIKNAVQEMAPFFQEQA